MFMGSLNIDSLFTNIPLEETIANYFYKKTEFVVKSCFPYTNLDSILMLAVPRREFLPMNCKID